MPAATTLAAFLVLAAECTPRTVDGRPIVAPETLAAVVRTESGFGELAVGINEPGARAPKFSTRAQAAAWVGDNQHRSLDVGLTQINSSARHMQRRGLPVAAALDGCTAIRVGSEVLRDCYRTAPARDEQVRLAAAASCYNTGTHTRGLAREQGGNGYVTRVQASAEIVVPAIRARGDAPAPAAAPQPHVAGTKSPDPVVIDAACGMGRTRRPGISPQMVLLDDDDCVVVPTHEPAAPVIPVPLAPDLAPLEPGHLGADAPPARIAVVTDRPPASNGTASAAPAFAATSPEKSQ